MAEGVARDRRSGSGRRGAPPARSRTAWRWCWPRRCRRLAAAVEIWASDLSLEMLKVAAGAIYTTRDVQGVSPPRLRRFFLLGRGPREGSFRIVPEIRDMVKFRHIDLRNPTWPVPTDFPMIFCRNVSIYFAEDERLTLIEPPGPAPASRGLAGDGQRRDPARRSPPSLRKHSPSLFQKEG